MPDRLTSKHLLYAGGARTAALISALQPLATAALAGPMLGELVRRRQWLGLGVGFARTPSLSEGPPELAEYRALPQP